MIHPRSLRARQRWEQDPKICPSLLSREGPSSAGHPGAQECWIPTPRARSEHPDPHPGQGGEGQTRTRTHKGTSRGKTRPSQGRGVKTETTEGFSESPTDPARFKSD